LKTKLIINLEKEKKLKKKQLNLSFSSPILSLFFLEVRIDNMRIDKLEKFSS
jgi:hypothetical protein